jgi:hypothetical protein
MMLRSERGSVLIESLLMLGLVVLIVAVATQALLYAHSRSVSTAAAQDGAREAAVAGAAAGVSRASAVLAAAGGTGADLHPMATSAANTVTVTVQGHAPRIFPLSLLLPAVSSSATLPRERYPADEEAAP